MKADTIYRRTNHRGLRQAEADAKTADLAREHGVSEATLYNWNEKYGGLELSEETRLHAPEAHNAQLKRLLVDSMPDNAGVLTDGCVTSY